MIDSISFGKTKAHSLNLHFIYLHAKDNVNYLAVPQLTNFSIRVTHFFFFTAPALPLTI
jgi:hypothetical protein